MLGLEPGWSRTVKGVLHVDNRDSLVSLHLHGISFVCLHRLRPLLLYQVSWIQNLRVLQHRDVPWAQRSEVLYGSRCVLLELPLVIAFTNFDKVLAVFILHYCVLREGHVLKEGLRHVVVIGWFLHDLVVVIFNSIRQTILLCVKSGCLNHATVVSIWFNLHRLFIDHLNIFIDQRMCGFYKCISINYLFDLYRIDWLRDNKLIEGLPKRLSVACDRLRSWQLLLGRCLLTGEAALRLPWMILGNDHFSCLHRHYSFLLTPSFKD